MSKEFRPAPLSLRQLRYGVRYNEYARFYGNYVSMTGKRKRFSFQIRVSPRLSGRQKYRLIVRTCNALLDNTIPQHRQGEVFDNFGDLLKRTKWFRVRKLRQYEAGMVYER